MTTAVRWVARTPRRGTRLRTVSLGTLCWWRNNPQNQCTNTTLKRDRPNMVTRRSVIYAGLGIPLLRSALRADKECGYADRQELAKLLCNLKPKPQTAIPFEWDPVPLNNLPRRLW